MHKKTTPVFCHMHSMNWVYRKENKKTKKQIKRNKLKQSRHTDTPTAAKQHWDHNDEPSPRPSLTSGADNREHPQRVPFVADDWAPWQVPHQPAAVIHQIHQRASHGRQGWSQTDIRRYHTGNTVFFFFYTPRNEVNLGKGGWGRIASIHLSVHPSYLLSGYLLDHWAFCNQIWPAGASSWAGVWCEKLGLLLSGSEAQWGFEPSKSDCFSLIFWTAGPVAIKLGA